MALTAGFILGFAILVGPQGDYTAYVSQWRLVLAGGPWEAYGPVHSLFAPMLLLHPLLPKAIFAGMALWVGWQLLERGLASRVERSFAIVLIFFVLNPIVVVSTYVYGQNDIVLALLLASALRARADGRAALAGTLVGVAGLVKFYPLVLAGFIALEGRRVLRVRVLTAAAVTFLMGLLTSWAVWGNTVLAPLLDAEARGPKMLSVLRFAVAHPQVFGGVEVVEALLRVNVGIMLAVTAAVFVALYWRGATWRAATPIGCLVLLASYKVGHPQFYVPWLVLVVWLLVDQKVPEERGVAFGLMPVVGFVGLFQVLYILGLVTTNSPIRDYAGLPFLVVVLGSLVATFRALGFAHGQRAILRW